MGLTKQYLRYVANTSFGLITSPKGGLTSLDKNTVISATAEKITIWDIKRGEKVCELQTKSEITSLTYNKKDKIAVGLQDGSILVFTAEDSDFNPDEVITFNGHKSAVTALTFDLEGHRLASGSRDTTVIVWDVINEAGLFKLKGHKGPITSLSFDNKRNVLISSSKDTFIKFWDLKIQHCFKTMTDHIMEVWDFVLVKDYLISATSDAELRVFKCTYDPVQDHPDLEPGLKKLKIQDDEEGDDDDNAGLKIERVGSLLRQGQDKCSHLISDDQGQAIACHGSDNTIELFEVCTEEEVKKRLSKKAKKERRKNGSGTPVLPEATIQEEFRRSKVIKCSGKVRQMELTIRHDSLNILVGTANNIIETFNVDFKDKNSEAVKVKKFDLQGHRSDVRSLTFSSCSTAIASVSHESVKIWNRTSTSCIRTISSGYGLSLIFAPGDRHVVVGTKAGTLQIFDLDKAEMTEEVTDAHEKEIWNVALNSDKKGFVTCSADQTVKFWSFVPVNEGWSVAHTKTLQLQEDALDVKLSPDGRLIAVSLMDSTIKVFFVDTLKFFLSLYGHKLPVLSMDISYDSTLIVTGSADKNVKIWGLDFGDCHKSIFAHDDNVTSVRFVPNTHYFFTAGKDGLVKQWDADNFQRILTLKGHLGEVWALAVSPNGKHVISSGHDKTLRLWEKTQEPLVLDDEREQEREQAEEDQLATGERRQTETDTEAGLPTKKTAQSERSAERLMEAILTYKNYQIEISESGNQKPVLPMLMLMYPDVSTAEDFMFITLNKIKSSELEETLLVLPLDVVLDLMQILETLLQSYIFSENMGRIFFFLVEIHFGPLSSSKMAKNLISNIKNLIDSKLEEMKQMVGFNLAALRYLQNEEDENEKVRALLEVTNLYKEKKRRKKQKQRAIQTAIISV